MLTFIAFAILGMSSCLLSFAFNIEVFDHSCPYPRDSLISGTSEASICSILEFCFKCLSLLISSYSIACVCCPLSQFEIFSYVAYILSVDFNSYLEDAVEDSIKSYLNIANAYNQSRAVIDNLNKINSVTMLIQAIYGIINFSYYFQTLIRASENNAYVIFAIVESSVPFWITMMFAAEANSKV